LVGVNKAQGLFTRYSYWEFCCRKNTPRRELEDWTSPWHWCRFISFVFTFAREVGVGTKGQWHEHYRQTDQHAKRLKWGLYEMRIIIT